MNNMTFVGQILKTLPARGGKDFGEKTNISSKGFTEAGYREYNDLLRIARGRAVLMELRKLKENISILAMDCRIRLVLYKGPSHLNTDIKGGEHRNVYVSGRGRNGVVLSSGRPPDYFES